MTFWYDQIEEPVRELVKRLRNNGINTTCSCGHEMYVQADILLDTQLRTMHDIAYNWLCEQEKEPNYTIDFHLDVRKGFIFQCFAELRISDQAAREEKGG